MNGLYLTFEGGEGGGKSLQSKLLAERLEQEGIPYIKTREPGGTPLGDQVRSLLFAHKEMTGRAEVLLFQAARAQLVEEIIRPALTEGRVVISDRSYWSSVAYQGHARGIGTQEVLDLSDFATAGIIPRRVYLLDIDPQAALQRKHAQQELTRFEVELLEFHQRVREGFLEQAALNGGPFKIVDATQPIETIQEEIWQDFKWLYEEQKELLDRPLPAHMR